jgi:hypothetical protein
MLLVCISYAGVALHIHLADKKKTAKKVNGTPRPCIEILPRICTYSRAHAASWYCEQAQQRLAAVLVRPVA